MVMAVQALARREPSHKRPNRVAALDKETSHCLRAAPCYATFRSSLKVPLGGQHYTGLLAGFFHHLLWQLLQIITPSVMRSLL